MDKKAALFFDIDGTLIDDRTNELPESAAEAVKRARAAGHLIFINTGRTVCSIPDPGRDKNDGDRRDPGRLRNLY